MKPSLKNRFSFPITAASLVAFSGTVHAAPVNWGTPTSIAITGVESTEAPQVLNEGTIGAAYNNGASSTSNGVTFPSNDGTITLVESGANFGAWAISGTPGWATEFQKVISGYHRGPGMDFTASNLTIGQDYKVQFFNYNPPGATITSGNSVTIDDQSVIGTFKADAATQVFNISSGGGINAAQIRIVNDSWTPADGIWTGGNGNWSTVGNWQANTIGQGVDKSATFNGLTPVTATVDVIRPIGALNFSGSNHTIAAGAGSLTLDVATLTAPTVTVASGIIATIAGTLVGSEGMVKHGIGTLVLTGTRGFTGTTEIAAGTLRYAGGSSASASHSIASGAVLEFNVASGAYDAATSTFNGEGALRKTGAGSLSWPATIATFALAPGALIDVQEGIFTAGSFANESWAGNLSDLHVAAGATFNTVEANVRVNKITGSGTIATGLAGAGYQNLTIGVDNGSSSFGGVVTDSLAPGNLVKTGTGTITLSGASTYTGRTTVEAGTLSLAQAFLNNNGTVVIGSSGILDLGFTGTDVVGSIEIAGSGPLPPGVYDTNHPDYGDYITGTGSLEILGGNGTWASLAPGDWSVASNWSGNKVASGINSIATFNAATAVTVNLDSTRTIGGLAFGTTGYALAGSSTLTLNTTSDISTITVNSGLAATISAKLASVDALTKAGTGTLTLSAQNNFSNAINVSEGTLELATDWAFGNVGTGTAIVPGLVTVESGATLRAVNALANQLNGLTLNGGTVEAVGGGNADWGNFHLTGNVTATGTSNLNADIALRAANVDFFVDSGATLNVGGVMHNGAFFGIYNGTPSNLSKSGDGTMVLSAANTYTGNTSIEDGTLSVAQPNFSNTSTVTIGTFGGSAAVLNLPNAGTDVVAALIIDGDPLPGNGAVYDSTNSGGAITGNGKIQVGTVPADPFANWMSTNYPSIGSPNNQAGADPDNDGIENLLEYALQGGDPSVSNPGILPTVNASGANFVFTYSRRTAATGTTQTFQYSPDLGATSWTDLAIPGGAGVVVGDPVDGIEQVQITVLKGTNTKLFGRLKVTKP